MSPPTSVFLDVLRLTAAFTVFAAHTTNFWNLRMAGPMQAWAHDAVVVFFVLSGYVIAHTARSGARDARGYTVARLARLYSVVIPALLLTAMLWVIGPKLDPAIYAHYEREYPMIRFFASGFFVNEVWTLELSPPTNTPFWSLGYEFWYYVFFGVALFVRSRALKLGLLVACALAIGAKVLMLLPVWLVGVAAYAWRDRWRISRGIATVGLSLAAGITALALYCLPEWPAALGAHPWHFSGAALSDLLCGLGWGAVIWFFDQSFRGGEVPTAVMRPVRWLAGHTFSLYLYHAPLVIFATALFPPVLLNAMWTAVLLIAILLVIAGLGALTEGQRLRWQRLFAWGWDRCVQGRLGGNGSAHRET